MMDLLHDLKIQESPDLCQRLLPFLDRLIFSEDNAELPMLKNLAILMHAVWHRVFSSSGTGKKSYPSKCFQWLSDRYAELFILNRIQNRVLEGIDPKGALCVDLARHRLFEVPLLSDPNVDVKKIHSSAKKLEVVWRLKFYPDTLDHKTISRDASIHELAQFLPINPVLGDPPKSQSVRMKQVFSADSQIWSGQACHNRRLMEQPSEISEYSGLDVSKNHPATSPDASRRHLVTVSDETKDVLKTTEAEKCLDRISELMNRLPKPPKQSETSQVVGFPAIDTPPGELTGLLSESICGFFCQVGMPLIFFMNQKMLFRIKQA